MKKTYELFLTGMLLTIVAPSSLQANIIGQTAGDTADGNGVDDMNTSATMDVSFQTYSSWLRNGLVASFPGMSFVFAGTGAVGSLFAPIISSDFNMLEYKPWVVNNFYNSATSSGINFVTAPNGTGVGRSVMAQDAGGADTVIFYRPRANSTDPTSLNFVQGFVENINNKNPGYLNGTGIIDNGGKATPFYNMVFLAGDGSTQVTGPLTASPTSVAWLVDLPYDCESFSTVVGKPFSNGSKPDCSGGMDDSRISSAVTFQTFVESNQSVWCNAALRQPYSRSNNGGVEEEVDVLYGGVQWGYTYSSVDLAPPVPSPEPSGVLLTGAVLGLALYFSARRRTGKLLK